MPKNFLYVSIYLLVILLIFLAILVFSIVYFGPEKYQVEKISNEQFVVFDEGKIRIQVYGIGKQAILLLHGFNGTMNQWDPVWPLLKNCGAKLHPKRPVRLLRIDIPGFGLSEWHSKDFSLSAQSQRIVQLLDRLKVDEVTLVGTSMGGSLSALMAAEYPQRVSSILLMAPSGYSGALNAGLIGSAVYRPGLINQFIFKIASTDIYQLMFPNSRVVQALSVTASYGAEWQSQLKKITQPTTILWSQSDSRVDFKYAKVIHEQILFSTLILASAQAGHNIPAQDPQLLAEQICQLL